MRSQALDEALAAVAPIVADVRARGDQALLEWTERLDGPRPSGIRVCAQAIETASVAPDVHRALLRMIDAVRRFNEAQRPADTLVEAAPGIVSERRWLPLASVGLCVPSGRAPLPSSLVMTAVPAQVAGVRRIAVVTPRPAEATLVVARELGLDEVYAVGGAQAVAALAYGTEVIPAVDKIVGPGSAYVTAAKLLVSSHVGIDLPAGPSEVVVIADETADPGCCAADLLAQAEHGPDSEALLLTTHRPLSDEVATLVDGYDNISIELVGSLDEALARSESFAPEHLELHVADPAALLGGVRNAGSVFVGGSAVLGDYAAGATHVLPTGGLARSSGGLGLESFLKPLQVVTATADGAALAAEVVAPIAGVEGLPLHAAAVAGERRALPGGGCCVSPGTGTPRTGNGTTTGSTGSTGSKNLAPQAIPLPEEFAPYAWARSATEVAQRHGLRVEQVLKFDQNTPPLPGVPRIPLARSFARLNDYPDGQYRELREAAAAYLGGSITWRQVVVGAGADDLILLCARTFLGPGRLAALETPTYSLYRIATQLAGAGLTDDLEAASLIWRCNPDNPTGRLTPASDLVALARSWPAAVVVVDEAYVEFGGESVAAYVDELPNLIVLRTLSKAFGFAALRVGYAAAAPETAAILDERRAPAPISAPAASIAAAALAAPSFDLGPTLRERERVRAALEEAGRPAVAAGNFVWLPTAEPLGERLETQGLVVRCFPSQGVRITLRHPSENDVLLRALGAEAGAAALGRSATVIRTTTETALRITLGLDGTGWSHVVTGIGFFDHLLTLLSFHAGFDLECVAGGDLEVDEHHLVEDVLASLGDALAQALGGREGITRYGSAVVPMDEALASAAVDLVRRPHAEITLSLTAERVGSLASSLLPHALERFAMQAGCTVHVESAGSDDHHIAEAAFKALGQALRQAVAPGAGGIRSTKGAA